MNSYKGYKLIHKTQLPVIGTPVMTISYPAFGVAMTLKTHDGQWAFFARENWTKEEEMEFDHEGAYQSFVGNAFVIGSYGDNGSAQSSVEEIINRVRWIEWVNI